MKMLMVLVAACTLAAAAHAQVPDFTPQTPLIGALLHGDSAEARRLLDAGADPNEGQFAGMPPLFLAIQRQDLALVRSLLAHGADPHARDRSGSTALMWAAFDEHGDAALVDELLRLGADPAIANRRGETALVWALRRGDTPAAAALRRSGGSAQATLVKTSVEKAITLLQKSGSQFAKTHGCYSCHHQALPLMAMDVARVHGVQVDEAPSREQVDTTIAVLRSVRGQAVANRDRVPDPPLSVSYALVALAAAHYAPDETTAAMTRVVAAWQNGDGAFVPLPPVRPPLEANTFTATALSLRALQVYGSNVDADRIARAAAWLRTARPRTTEDRAMQLLGLTWAHVAAADLRKPADALLAEQRQDGGWSQLPALETDPYATGQALVALQSAGHPVTSPEYQRGVSYLLRTQFHDGSWLVRSRTFPVQPLRDSGFPHGKDQWISAAGTSWAAMALSLTLPADAASGSVQ
jgi:ankyrin repeat protein